MISTERWAPLAQMRTLASPQPTQKSPRLSLARPTCSCNYTCIHPVSPYFRPHFVLSFAVVPARRNAKKENCECPYQDTTETAFPATQFPNNRSLLAEGTAPEKQSIKKHNADSNPAPRTAATIPVLRQRKLTRTEKKDTILTWLVILFVDLPGQTAEAASSAASSLNNRSLPGRRYCHRKMRFRRDLTSPWN